MTQQEVIKTFMQSLDKTELSGRAALDEAIQASSSFQNFEDFKRKFLADLATAKNWQTFLIEKCGIILDNEDTGAISGSDAGGTKKGAADILPSKGKAKYPEGTSFTVDGLTIYGIPPKENLTDDQQIVVQGLYSWWIRDALKLIEESYGFSFSAEDATNSRMKLKFVNDENENFLAYVSFDGSDGKEFESRVLCVNMAFFKDMDATNRHPKTDKGQGLDRTLVHELVHGLMSSNVNYFGDLPGFLAEGGSAELIHGLDDENRNRIISTIQNTDALKEIFTTLGIESRSEVYDGGYIIMRYFAKQAATDTTFDYDTYQATVTTDSDNFAVNYWNEVTMQGGDSASTFSNAGESVTINGGADNDTIRNYSQEVVINAGGGLNVISNIGNNVTANGGYNVDAITNEGANVLVNGGDGLDVLNNKGANSVIKGDAGSDLINNSIVDYETLNNASNFVITTSKNEELFTVANSALLGGNNSTLVGGDGTDNIVNQADAVQVFGEKGADSITNCGFNSTIFGGDDNDFILNTTDEIEVNSKAENAKNGDKDKIFVTGYRSKLFGNRGNDLFQNVVDEVEIFGQNDNDTIRNAGKAVSISGGTGNDYVFNGEVVISDGESSATKTGGNLSIIFLDAGRDTIENIAVSIKVEGGAGNDQFINSGDTSTLNGDAGNDDFKNYGDEVTISGGAGSDFIYTSGNKVSLTGGAGKDSIQNEGSEVYMLTGKSKDSINNAGDRASILADAGNDYIQSSGNNSSILGGKGRDSIVNDGNNVSISGGKGNDKLWGGKNSDIFLYGKGDGKDIIYNFDNADILQITGKFSGSYNAKKNEVAFQVGSTKNAITLKDFTATTFNVNGDSYQISNSKFVKK